MADADRLLLQLRPGLVPVPAAGQPGICRFCHSSCKPDFDQCYPCLEAHRSIGAVEILPISMSVDGDLLHRHLRGYKDDRDAQARQRMTTRLAGVLAVFLRHHRRCLGDFDTVCAVPSADRVAPEFIIDRIPSLRDSHERTLASSVPGGHTDLRSDRFAVTRAVAGERVLLFDDTFTRGGSVYSAASTLREAGATVIGPLVIGRHVQPAFGPSETMLSSLKARSWDETRCCRCNGELRSPNRLF